MFPRIALIHHWPAKSDASTVIKALTQLRLWKELGADAKMFALSPQETAPPGLPQMENFQYVGGVGRKARFTRAGYLANLIGTYRPDIVYSRFTVWYPYLELLARRACLILELNTIDESEMRVTENSVTQLFHHLTRSRLLEAAAGHVAVTAEIVGKVLKDSSRSVVIPNGIDFDNVEAVGPVNNSVPHLAFVGSPRLPWHGLDELARFAAMRQSWQFDIIGSAASELGWELPSNMVCHGYLPASRYRAILGMADVAVGSLALYRNEMQEACPLKTREYLALGLPVIFAHKDSDFPCPTDFMLELPNAPGAMTNNTAVIDEFVGRWSGRRVPRSRILHLDSLRKEKARLDYFRLVALRNQGQHLGVAALRICEEGKSNR